MPTRCFWLTLTGRVVVSLRRYASGEGIRCPKMPSEHSYHDRSVDVGTAKAQWKLHNVGRRKPLKYLHAPKKPRTDPRWPKRCSCGYRFKASDHWQVNVEPLYTGSPDGKQHTEKTVPNGAIWDTSIWNSDRGPDGLCIVIKIPSGADFPIDAMGGWTRKGDPRKPETLSIQPSTNHEGQWHGYLTNGVLEP